MPRKSKMIRALDVAPANQSLAPAPDASTADLAPPLPSSALEPPTNLVLVAALARSASTPTALINATWDPPTGVGAVEKYTVQWSTSNTFPAATTVSADTFYEGAVIDGLLTSTLYYVRVSAWAHGIQSQWSAMVPLTTGVNRVTTPADTIPPAVPTAPASVFVNAGDLRTTWIEPPLSGSPNLRDVEIKIWNSAAKTILYLTDFSTTGQYIFTAAMNGEATSYAYDPSLYVELRSRSWGNQFSTAVVVGTITKARPVTPSSLASSWASDAGLAGPDCTITWSSQDDAAFHRLTIDGVVRDILATRLIYTLDANRAEHGGTPDAALTISLVAVDGLKQTSATPATLTATNAAPATPTATLEQGAVSGLHATVTSVPPADFLANEFVFKRDGTTVATVVSPQASAGYPMQGAADVGYHSWTVVVRQKDLFGQFSPTVTPAAVVFEGLTLAGLRAQAAYTDSDGNTPATLAALKDGITTSGGVSYSA
jgi:hypothetical protein